MQLFELVAMRLRSSSSTESTSSRQLWQAAADAEIAGPEMRDQMCSKSKDDADAKLSQNSCRDKYWRYLRKAHINCLA